MQLLLGATNYRVEKEEELVRQLLTRNPEALVMTGGHHTQATRNLVSAQGLPVIEIWDLPKEPLGHAVGFSNADAMALVVDHLAETGRRKLAFLGASDGADSRGAERRAGVPWRRPGDVDCQKWRSWMQVLRRCPCGTARRVSRKWGKTSRHSMPSSAFPIRLPSGP